VRRMRELRKIMADHLRPDKIMATLANLSGQLAFLPAPPHRRTNPMFNWQEEWEAAKNSELKRLQNKVKAAEKAIVAAN